MWLLRKLQFSLVADGEAAPENSDAGCRLRDSSSSSAGILAAINQHSSATICSNTHQAQAPTTTAAALPRHEKQKLHLCGDTDGQGATSTSNPTANQPSLTKDDFSKGIAGTNSFANAFGTLQHNSCSSDKQKHSPSSQNMLGHGNHSIERLKVTAGAQQQQQHKTAKVAAISVCKTAPHNCSSFSAGTRSHSRVLPAIPKDKPTRKLTQPTSSDSASSLQTHIQNLCSVVSVNQVKHEKLDSVDPQQPQISFLTCSEELSFLTCSEEPNRFGLQSHIGQQNRLQQRQSCHKNDKNGQNDELSNEEQQKIYPAIPNGSHSYVLPAIPKDKPTRKLTQATPSDSTSLQTQIETKTQIQNPCFVVSVNQVKHEKLDTQQPQTSSSTHSEEPNRFGLQSKIGQQNKLQQKQSCKKNDKNPQNDGLSNEEQQKKERSSIYPTIPNDSHSCVLPAIPKDKPTKKLTQATPSDSASSLQTQNQTKTQIQNPCSVVSVNQFKDEKLDIVDTQQLQSSVVSVNHEKLIADTQQPQISSVNHEKLIADTQQPQISSVEPNRFGLQSQIGQRPSCDKNDKNRQNDELSNEEQQKKQGGIYPAIPNDKNRQNDGLSNEEQKKKQGGIYPAIPNEKARNNKTSVAKNDFTIGILGANPAAKSLTLQHDSCSSSASSWERQKSSPSSQKKMFGQDKMDSHGQIAPDCSSCSSAKTENHSFLISASPKHKPHDKPPEATPSNSFSLQKQIQNHCSSVVPGNQVIFTNSEIVSAQQPHISSLFAENAEVVHQRAHSEEQDRFVSDSQKQQQNRPENRRKGGQSCNKNDRYRGQNDSSPAAAQQIPTNIERQKPGNLRKFSTLMEGEVVRLRQGFGFMRKLSYYREEETQDIYFKHGDSSSTETGMLELCLGDILEFAPRSNWGPNSGKQSAVFARLVHCRRRTPVALFQYMASLCSKTNYEEVLGEIVKCPAGLAQVLAIQNPCKEIVVSVLKLCDLLSRNVEASLNRARFQQFFGFFRGSPFLKVLGQFVSQFCQTDEEEEQGMVLFSGFVTNSVNYVNELGPDMMRMLVSAQEISSMEHNTPLSRFCKLLVQLMSVSFKRVVDNWVSMKWYEMPLVPVTDEFLSESTRIPLPYVKKQGSYGSVDCYVDTYYRLLREDCFGPLRKGIKALKEGKLDIRDMKVWTNVCVIGFHIHRREPGLTVVMTAERLVFPGKKRLTYAPPMEGNLICISLDSQYGSAKSFNCPIWAIIFKSEDKTDKIQVYAEIVSGPSKGSNSTTAYTVESLSRLLLRTNSNITFVENPSFYKSYEPVLRGLQKMNWQSFPFIEEFVMARWPQRPPQYLAEPTALVDWSCIFGEDNPLVAEVNAADSLIKAGYKLMLDSSQFEALKLALRNRLALIQGPPGTGKTFIGTRILRVLLSASTLPAGPALVITYKNQGLDHFLRGCLKFCPDGLVRVGGRSTEEALNAFNLHNLVRRRNDEFSLEYDEISEKLEPTRAQVEQAIQDVCDSTSFNVNIFVEELKDNQLRSFIFHNQNNGEAVLNLIPDGMTVAEYAKSDSSESKKLSSCIINTLGKWLPTKEIFQNIRDSLGPAATSGRLIDSFILKGTEEIEEETEELKTWTEQYLEAKHEEEAFTHTIDKNFKRAEEDIFKPKIRDAGNPFKEITLCEIYKEQHQWLMDEDLWELNSCQRAIFVQLIMDRTRQKAIKKLEDSKKAYDDICRALEEIEKKRKLKVLREAKIVGMTATGVAMHQDIVSALKPSILFVEEAAEVLEPQLVVAISPEVQHVILIGDHYQLSPSVQVYELEKRHDFAVSLFERLVEHNHMPYQSLMHQSRMREEFVPMLKPIYPQIQTSCQYVSGERNQSPNCVGKPMYFWSHSYEEDKQRSVKNPGEAEMVVTLVDWLISEGQVPEEITVICAYNGQVSLIRKMLKDNPHMPDVQVVTVDRFQGSENKVIILSLVRSNKEGIIGHLGKRNRMCVAVSRARGAFYMCGNKSTLTKRSKHWVTLLNYMREQNCVGKEIPLKCPRHPDKTYMLASRNAKSFKSQLCKRPCAYIMDCWHRCNAPCHFGNHKKCEDSVQFIYKNCGHQGIRKCTETEDTVPCCQEVVHTHVACQHRSLMKCWQRSKSKPKCREPCSKILDCGHPCTLECYKNCTANECSICIKIRKAELERERKARMQEIQFKKQCIEEDIKKLLAESKNFFITDIHDSGSTAAEFMQVLDRTVKFTQPGHNMVFTVTRIQKVFNKKLEIKFLEARRDLFKPDAEPQLLFHGTSDESVKGITKEGFRLPAANKNTFGKGCYFATDSSKSAQSIYTKGSNKLLLCSVLLGEPWTVQEDYPNMDAEKLRKKGFDSLYSKRGGRGSGGTLYDEFVVYDPRQATPRYIVHFRFMADPKPLSASDFSNNFTRITIKPSETFSGDTSNEYHFRLAESQFYRMSKDRNRHKVVQVDLILNKSLQKQYESAKSQMGTKAKEMWVFHGTRKEAIDNIIKDGFKIGGQGVAVRHGAEFIRPNIRTWSEVAAYGSAKHPDISVPYSGGQGMMLLSLAIVGSRGPDYSHGASQDVLVYKRSDFLLPRYVVFFD